MLFQDLSAEIIKQTIRDERVELKRQYDAVNEKLRDFYEDRQLQDEYIKDWGFKKKDNTTDLPLASYNVTKKIINKISLVYKNAPERGIIDTKEDADDAYEQWITLNPKFNQAIKQAERYKNLLGKVLYRPHYKKETESWVFFVESYYEAHFLDGDPLNPVAYSYPLKQRLTDVRSETEDWWVFWSNDLYFFYIPGTNTTKIDTKFPDDKNPFGIIPFVELRDNFPVNQYECSGAVSLMQANENINIAMNDLNLMVHYQAFDQPIGTGIQEKEAKNIEMGPQKIVLLGDPESNISLLGYSPQIMDSIEAVKFQLNTIAEMYNLRMSASLDKQGPVSGFSLLVQNIDLLEAREDDVEIAEIGEKEIYKVISSMQDYYKLKPSLPKDAEITVNFADIDFPINQKEELDIRDWYIEHNIKTPLDYMDTDLDDEAKLELFRKNKEINGKLTARDKILETVEAEGGIVEEV